LYGVHTGTVCILGRNDAEGEAAVARVAARYAAETGHAPQLFEGSSMGADAFGHVCIRRRVL
jgi:L-arabinokinase